MIKVRDRYKLELHWSKVDYSLENKIRLLNTYFSGPALNISQKIQPNNKMTLDLSNLYYVFIPNYYLSNLNWNAVEYTDSGKVLLGEVTMEGFYLNSIPKLKNTDFFIINTSNHEEHLHPFYLTYDAWLLNENKEIYKF